MATYKGGTRVNHGFYWSVQAWDMAMAPAEGCVLPGGTERSYARIPTFLFLLVAPLMGALYVFFLPVVGFALLFKHVALSARTLATDAFMGVAVAVSPHWAPGEAYLAGRRKERADKAAARAQARRVKHDKHDTD
jgi:hypothetical protein